MSESGSNKGTAIVKHLASWILLNCLVVGSYQFYVAYNKWTGKEVKPVATAKIDYGHEPEELALNMDTELLKQMEKAVKNELKFRVNK